MRFPLSALVLLAAGSSGALAQSPQSPAQPTTPEYRLGGPGVPAVEQVSAPEPGTDAAVISDARRALAEERPSVAQRILDRWIEQNSRGASPLLPQAYFLRGDAISAQGDEFQALYDYEAVIKNFSASREYALAVERELEIAVRYVNGLDRKFLGIRWVDATDIGEELLIRVQERLPGSKIAERAGIELADHYYRARDMELASIAYDLFLKNFPQSAYRSRAMQRRIYANIAQFKGPEYDGRPLLDAAALIGSYQNQFPAQAAEAGLDDALLTRIDESGGLQMLRTAEWYIRTNDPVSARYTLQRLITSHPRTAAAGEAMRIMEEKGWALAVEQPPEKPSPSPIAPPAAPVAPAVPAPAPPSPAPK